MPKDLPGVYPAEGGDDYDPRCFPADSSGGSFGPGKYTKVKEFTDCVDHFRKQG